MLRLVGILLLAKPPARRTSGSPRPKFRADVFARLTGFLLLGMSVTDRHAAPALTRAGPINVLLVTSDTTRRDVLGCYGGGAATPNIDALAADGVVMDNAFSVAFGTLPSHSSLMAATPAALHGVYDNETILGPDFTTLAERLLGAGYSTAAFVGSRVLDRQLGIDQGFETYDDEFEYDAASGLGDFSFAERRADKTVARALDWLHLAPRKPFFAWIHFNDAHQPYWPPGSSGDGPHYVKVQGDLRERMQSDPKFREEFEEDSKARYRREIEHIDGQLGRLLDDLRERGLYDSTLIVFVADHGENFGEHGLDLVFDHASVLSSVSRLPLILKLPGSQQRGDRSSALVGNLDIAPTIVDELDLSQPSSWSGISFRTILEGASRPIRSYLILEGAYQEEVAVRTPTVLYREVVPEVRWDPEVLAYLGYAPDDPIQFYSLESDPAEVADRFPTPDAAPFANLAARFLAERHPPPVRTLDSPDQREGLKSLGYLD